MLVCYSYPLHYTGCHTSIDKKHTTLKKKRRVSIQKITLHPHPPEIILSGLTTACPFLFCAICHFQKSYSPSSTITRKHHDMSGKISKLSLLFTLQILLMCFILVSIPLPSPVLSLWYSFQIPLEPREKTSFYRVTVICILKMVEFFFCLIIVVLLARNQFLAIWSHAWLLES